MSEASIGAILDRLYYEAETQRDKGTAFERLVQAFLRTDPTYAARFDEVWMWSQWPDRGVRPDRGIDLVARHRDGSGLCAVQCKFYDPERAVTKADVDTFLAESGSAEFASRLVVSTTNRWNQAAEDTISRQAVPVTRIGLDDLFNSTLDWDAFSLDEPQELKRTQGKTPRPHQVEAMDAVMEGLRSADRGKLIMACGTGKTFTALQIAQRMTQPEGGRVLFLVPSIALLSQTLREWMAEASQPIRAFAVCSDAKVNKGRSSANEDISVVDLAIPATTDGARLAGALKVPAPRTEVPGHVLHAAPMTVVFATYQSIDVVHRAQEQGAPDFDLIICDEAHRTTGATVAGQDESAFVRVHDAEYIRASKRLYMTATPRVYAADVKDNAQRKDLVLASMDDEGIYGPELFRLGFGRAVEQGLLTDYKVLVLTVSEEQVSRTLQDSLASGGDIALDDAARIVGCWNALAKQTQDPADYEADPGPMRTAVAFASNIRASKRFAGSVGAVVEDYGWL
ncbi:DEAD/DEAH box helicase family protein [Actinomyces bowdenii]|uniref:restriction endonuclease n=1 Tax=Actinomyces bowdenii TaxID=131109 RepID=UPI00214C3BE6|nr:DEAD/DEAH box helicase family protein [Actinomyces bowdenii]